MASKKTLNLDNLQALGAKRLAELLLELAAGDAAAKRRLRLELSAEAGPEAVAADIGKRLAALRQARSFVDWQKRPAFVKDLDRQRRLILDKVAEDRPDLALELLWRFTALAGPVQERVDDSRGDVGDVFRQACRDLGAVAARASPDPARLADRVSRRSRGTSMASTTGCRGRPAGARRGGRRPAQGAADGRPGGAPEGEGRGGARRKSARQARNSAAPPLRGAASAECRRRHAALRASTGAPPSSSPDA